MSSSLDKLVKNLSSDQFTILPKHLTQNYTSISNGQCALKLLSRKGVFPYEYADSWEKLEETSLPPQKAFYSQLTDSHISDCDYLHAQIIWDTFKIRTLGEYCDLYLKTDTLLLAEVFENFRKICMHTYQLDPCQYLTAPSLSWNAMLKYTQVELELFTDFEMVQFIKSSIRGGISQTSKRHVKANNKFMETYDPNQESNFIIHLDINNLYGFAMRQYLPISDFKWLTECEIKTFSIDLLQPDSNTGYILEVDLEYPKHLHDLHNDYPFCAESIKPPGSKTKKLLLTLSNKTNYIIHYVNLKQCLEQGLLCKKIHRILSFRQTTWLRPYIDLNTQMRAQAKNSFEKDFFKLMNNAIFGKTIENVEKRVDVKLCNTWEDTSGKTKCSYGLERYVSKPNFHSFTIFSENLVGVQLNQTKIVYNKPIYTGFCVLELSKSLMYDFHFNYIIPKYGKNVNLVYTDTDSFIYDIETKDFYEDIKPELESRFDTSDFPTNNVYGLPQINKKIVGMMKDETNGKIITEFVGLRSKMYAYKLDDDNKNIVKKDKGVTASVVRKIQFSNYYECLDLSNRLYDTIYSLVSKKHDMYTQGRRKLVLCGNDDKRFINNDKITTLAWGHYKIAESMET